MRSLHVGTLYHNIMRISTTRKMIRIILAYKDHKKMTGSNNNNNNNKIGKSF